MYRMLRARWFSEIWFGPTAQPCSELTYVKSSFPPEFLHVEIRFGFRNEFTLGNLAIE